MGRDHSCEKCGRGGFNDPDGECICRERTCLTCGTRVEVVSTDEGTHHYRPARDEGLSDEDRARLETMIERAQSGQRWTDLSDSFADLMTRALALIDQQTEYLASEQRATNAMSIELDQQAKALEAADEVVRFVWEECKASVTPGPVKDACAAYRATRATEGSTDG